MASERVELIATLFPKPGKVDRVIELLNEMSDFVKEHEPKTLRYQLHREINKKTGEDDLVLWETYENMDALRAHGGTEQFKAFSKKLQEEDLVTKPADLKFLKAIGGFTSTL